SIPPRSTAPGWWPAAVTATLRWRCGRGGAQRGGAVPRVGARAEAGDAASSCAGRPGAGAGLTAGAEPDTSPSSCRVPSSTPSTAASGVAGQDLVDQRLVGEVHHHRARPLRAGVGEVVAGVVVDAAEARPAGGDLARVGPRRAAAAQVVDVERPGVPAGGPLEVRAGLLPLGGDVEEGGHPVVVLDVGGRPAPARAVRLARV